MGRIGLFGKLPATGDFVGLQGGRDARALQGWMQRGHEEAAGRLLDEPVYFVAQFPGSAEVFCGSWIRSEDCVGRGFPLVAYLRLPDELRAASFGVLPAALQPFLDGAVQVLSEVGDRPYRAVEHALSEVPRPDPRLLTAAVDRCGQASWAERVSTFVCRVFGEGGGDQLAYAVHAISVACGGVRSGPPKLAGISLDCPVGIDLDLFFWTDLVQRSLRWRLAGPGMFWTEQAPRLVLTLGPAPSATVEHLTCSRPSSASWPLRTDRADALERAARALPEGLRQVVTEDRPLGALLARVA